MNYWTELSVEYANQMSYLDDLFQVYPLASDGIREINTQQWNRVQEAFAQEDNEILFRELLKLDLFPIKDSYVGFLREDISAINRNPNTVARICGAVRGMGLAKVFERCSEPKETNRQIGPLFRRWLNQGVLGVTPVPLAEFTSNNDNAILDAGDKGLKDFAQEHLNYHRNKGLDFVGRFNGKYVIGEAKFITRSGGNQDKSFEDAAQTLLTEDVNAVKIAVLDGVIYLKRKSKMFTAITTTHSELNIMSALVLRDFLYQI